MRCWLAQPSAARNPAPLNPRSESVGQRDWAEEWIDAVALRELGPGLGAQLRQPDVELGSELLAYASTVARRVGCTGQSPFDERHLHPASGKCDRGCQSDATATDHHHVLRPCLPHLSAIRNSWSSPLRPPKG